MVRVTCLSPTKSYSYCSSAFAHLEFLILQASNNDSSTRINHRATYKANNRYNQGFKSRPEPVRKPRLPVKPVRTGSGSGRFQTGPNSKFKFKFQKMKNSQKISKNTSSCDESNGVKFFQIFVHLVYFASI